MASSGRIMERLTNGYQASSRASEANRVGKLELATLMSPAPSYQLAELMENDVRVKCCADWALRDQLLLESMTSSLQLFPPSPNKLAGMLSEDDQLYQTHQPLSMSPVYDCHIYLKPMRRRGQFLAFKSQAEMDAESQDYLRIGSPFYSIQREDEYNKIARCYDTVDFGSELMSRFRVRIGCYGKQYSWPFSKILKVELGLMQLLDAFNPGSPFFRHDLITAGPECFGKIVAPDNIGFIPYKGVKDLSDTRIARLQDVIYQVSVFDRIFPLKEDRDYARLFLGVGHDELRDRHCLLTVTDFHHIASKMIVLPRRERRAYVLELSQEGEAIGSLLFCGTESKLSLDTAEIPFNEALFGLEVPAETLFVGSSSSSLDLFIDHQKTLAHLPGIKKEFERIEQTLAQYQKREKALERLQNAKSLIPTITRGEFNWACRYFHSKSPLEVIQMYKSCPWISQHYSLTGPLLREVVAFTTSTYFHMRVTREPGIYGLPRQHQEGHFLFASPRSSGHRMFENVASDRHLPEWIADSATPHQPNFEHLTSGTSGLSPSQPSTHPNDVLMGLDQTLHGPTEPRIEYVDLTSSTTDMDSRVSGIIEDDLEPYAVIGDLSSEESLDVQAAEPDSTETRPDHGFDYSLAALDMDYILELERQDRIKRKIPEPSHYSDDIFTNSFGLMSLGQITRLSRTVNMSYVRRMRQKLEDSKSKPLIRHLASIGWPTSKITEILQSKAPSSSRVLGQTPEEHQYLIELAGLDLDIRTYESDLDSNNGAAFLHEQPDADELLFRGNCPQPSLTHAALEDEMEPKPTTADYLRLIDSSVMSLTESEAPVPRNRTRRVRGYCKLPKDVIPVDHRTLKGTPAYGSPPTTMITNSAGAFVSTSGTYALYTSPRHGQPDPEFHRKLDQLERYTKTSSDGERIIPNGTLQLLLRDYCRPRQPLGKERRSVIPERRRKRAAGREALDASSEALVVGEAGRLEVKTKVVIRITSYMLREPTSASEEGGRPWCGAITSCDSHGSNSLEFFSEMVGELAYQSRFWDYSSATLERSLVATSPGRRFFNIAFSPGGLTETRPSHIRRDDLPVKFGGRFLCLLCCGARLRKSLEEGSALNLSESVYRAKMAAHQSRPMIPDSSGQNNNMKNQPDYVRASTTGDWYLVRDDSGTPLFWEQDLWHGMGWYFRGLNFSARKKPKKLVLAFGKTISLFQLHAFYGLVSYFAHHQPKIRVLYEEFCESEGIDVREHAVSSFRFPPALVSPRWSTYVNYLDVIQGSGWRDDLQNLINLAESGDTTLLPPYDSSFSRKTEHYFADAVYRLPSSGEEFIGRVDRVGNIVSMVEDLEKSNRPRWDYGFAIASERSTPLEPGQLRHYSSIEGLEDSML